jgi:hypothetical protein
VFIFSPKTTSTDSGSANVEWVIQNKQKEEGAMHGAAVLK